MCPRGGGSRARPGQQRGTHENTRKVPGAAASESTRAVEPCASGCSGEPRQAWGRHSGDEGAGWAVYMLCRLDGRNDRPCSARLAEAGSEALGDSSSSLRIAAVTRLQQEARAWARGLRCGRSRWRHSGRCYSSALGGGRAGNKTLLITSMLTQQQHRADPANQRTHRPEAAAQMQQRG